MDADCVLDGPDIAAPSREFGVEIVDGALAVAAERKAVGHVSRTVLAQVESVLALVGVLRVSAIVMCE